MRLRCSCGSFLFYVHVPPKNIDKHARLVYLLCRECPRIWPVKFGFLPEVNKETGIFRIKPKKIEEVKELTEPEMKELANLLELGENQQ